MGRPYRQDSVSALSATKRCEHVVRLQSRVHRAARQNLVDMSESGSLEAKTSARGATEWREHSEGTLRTLTE